MNISINWIKDYVDLDSSITPKELGLKFTLATCEVEEVIETGAHLERIIVVEITKIEPHPDAEKLRLVTFNCGDREERVVCGAPNVEIGLKVPFASIGTTLPGGFTLEPKKIRGIESAGMLCAEDELGLSDDHEGLMVLDPSATVGQTLASYLEVKGDILFEIDNKSITHRPDLWGHYGMAREFAAVFNKDLKQPFSNDWKESMKAKFSSDPSPVTIEVDSDSACLGYLGLSVDNVTVKPSPKWMQQRLNDAGMRPINNIVDISNYVMLELGMPNHLFDRTTIKGGKIVVKRMGSDTPFTTLDGEERKIIASDTMVCDAEGPSVIAGIMGGLNSSVKDDTTQIFIEAANWVDAEVRKTSTRIGLRTDSSQRYEKCLDSHQLETAVLRILELLLESCPDAKVIGGLESDGVVLLDKLTLKVSCSKISKVLGTEVSKERIISILESLDFKVAENGDEITVDIPSYRSTKDIECDADIIEEIGRIIGYDNIEPVSPLNKIEVVRLSNSKRMMRKIEDFMVYHANALEIMSYPLIGEKLLEKADWSEKNENLRLINALSPETKIMRPSLVPSLIEKCALNHKHLSKFRFFEMGRSYRQLDNDDFSEDRYQLGVLFFDKSESQFMDLLNIMKTLIRDMGVNAQIGRMDNKHKHPLVESNWSGLHPNETLNIKIMGKNSGFITTVHPVLSSNFKIKGNFSIAVLDITDFFKRDIKDKNNYTPLAKFQGSTFDCSVVAKTKCELSQILSVFKKIRINQIESVKIVDVFQLSDEEKSVTIRVSFLDREKTLSHDFLKESEDEIVQTLANNGFPLKV